MSVIYLDYISLLSVLVKTLSTPYASFHLITQSILGKREGKKNIIFVAQLKSPSNESNN